MGIFEKKQPKEQVQPAPKQADTTPEGPQPLSKSDEATKDAIKEFYTKARDAYGVILTDGTLENLEAVSSQESLKPYEDFFYSVALNFDKSIMALQDPSKVPVAMSDAEITALVQADSIEDARYGLQGLSYVLQQSTRLHPTVSRAMAGVDKSQLYKQVQHPERGRPGELEVSSLVSISGLLNSYPELESKLKDGWVNDLQVTAGKMVDAAAKLAE